MKYLRILLAVTLVFTLCSAFSMKKEKEKDSVVLDKRGFLPQRELYSYQLKNYLEYELAKPDYTCMIYFSENKNKLQKEASKVKGKYVKGNLKLQSIAPSDFSFKKPEE